MAQNLQWFENVLIKRLTDYTLSIASLSAQEQMKKFFELMNSLLNEAQPSFSGQVDEFKSRLIKILTGHKKDDETYSFLRKCFDLLHQDRDDAELSQVKYKIANSEIDAKFDYYEEK